jgi:predicted protein tyrosine phosphatase
MAVVVLPRLMAEEVNPPAGHVCISITNPRQSPARLQAGWEDVLRLGFHDTDRTYGNTYIAMSFTQAKEIVNFALKHRKASVTVHCEAGASRSVGVGAFLAAWRREQLELKDDVLFPNPMVVRQLRLAGVVPALQHGDRRLLQVCWRGPLALRHEYAAPTLYVPEHQL